MGTSEIGISVSEYIFKIEKYEYEMKNTRKKISNLLKEAVANGFNKRAIQEVVRARKLPKKQREKQQELFELYIDECSTPATSKIISWNCKEKNNQRDDAG